MTIPELLIAKDEAEATERAAYLDLETVGTEQYGHNWFIIRDLKEPYTGIMADLDMQFRDARLAYCQIAFDLEQAYKTQKESPC